MRSTKRELGVNGFFHSLVVMGGTVALGCGGVTSGTRHDVDGAGGSGDDDPPDESTPNSGGTGSPPMVIQGTGGSFVFGTGGTSSGGMTPAPPPPKCPPQQYACTDGYSDCSYQDDGVRLRTDCGCDPSRPLGANDCAPGQSFVCLKGVADPNDAPLGKIVPYACRCVDAPADCHACENAYISTADGFYCDATAREPNGLGGEVLCGCAFVYLR